MTSLQETAVAGAACLALVEFLLVLTGLDNMLSFAKSRSIRRHKALFYYLLLPLTIFLPVVIETALQLGDGVRVIDSLLLAHLAFAISFVACTAAILLRFNGENEKYRRYHPTAAVCHAILCMGTLITAFLLIPRLH